MFSITKKRKRSHCLSIDWSKKYLHEGKLVCLFKGLTHSSWGYAGFLSRCNRAADICEPLQLSLLSPPAFPLFLVGLLTNVTSVPLCAEQCTQICGSQLFFSSSLVNIMKVKILLLYQHVKHGKCFIFAQTELELSHHHLIQQLIHRACSIQSGLPLFLLFISSQHHANGFSSPHSFSFPASYGCN